MQIECDDQWDIRTDQLANGGNEMSLGIVVLLRAHGSMQVECDSIHR